MIILTSRTTDHSVYCLCYQKFMNKLFSQLLQYSAKSLNSILWGVHKAHSAQHVYFKLLHPWWGELFKCGFVGTTQMDLSKAYDCISHELLIARLECYNLHEISLKLTLNYLSHHKQRIMAASSFSSLTGTYIGVSKLNTWAASFSYIY